MLPELYKGQRIVRAVREGVGLMFTVNTQGAQMHPSILAAGVIYQYLNQTWFVTLLVIRGLISCGANVLLVV